MELFIICKSKFSTEVLTSAFTPFFFNLLEDSSFSVPLVKTHRISQPNVLINAL